MRAFAHFRESRFPHAGRLAGPWAREADCSDVRFAPKQDAGNQEHRCGSAVISGVPVAIEVQISSLTPETIQRRTLEYACDGIYVLWTWHSSVNHPEKLERKEVGGNSQLTPWFRRGSVLAFSAMTALTKMEQDKFLREHLRHRLTLLRTLRERKKCGHNYQGQGDIYRCVKDSNLNAVRFLLDFLGLKGESVGNDYKLTPRPRGRGVKFSDDVKIDQFIGRLLTPPDVPASSQRILAGVYKRADKELAHLTTTFNEEFNEENVLIEAATAVENLFQQFLYAPLGEKLPEMDA